MDRPVLRESEGEHALLTISEASSMLGVTEVTLRQWTDEGKVKAFVTPGGHRRYSRMELQRMVRTQKQFQNIKDLVVQLEGVAEQERDIARKYFSHTSWYGSLSKESEAYLSDTGKQLLNLVIKYASEPSKRMETASQIRNIGRDLGKELARLGFSLIDTAEAFVLHRTPVVNAANNLLKTRKPLDKRTVEVMPLINRIMDDAFLSLVSAYQEYRNGTSQSNSAGGGL